MSSRIVWRHKKVNRGSEDEKNQPTQKKENSKIQPRPTKGILVAITVINSTFASSGRLAM